MKKAMAALDKPSSGERLSRKQKLSAGTHSFHKSGSTSDATSSTTVAGIGILCNFGMGVEIMCAALPSLFELPAHLSLL